MDVIVFLRYLVCYSYNIFKLYNLYNPASCSYFIRFGHCQMKNKYEVGQVAYFKAEKHRLDK